MSHDPKNTARPAHGAKKKEIESLNDRFKRAEVLVMAEVRGITVDKVTQLRADLRKGKSELKVVKNTLAIRALVGTKYEALKEKFRGPVAVALNYSDVVHPAKILDAFQRDNDGKGLKIIGGSLAGKDLSVAEVKELASLPDLDTSRARLLGFLMQPAAGFVRLLAAHYKKQGGGAEAEPKAEAKEAEAPAAPAAAPVAAPAAAPAADEPPAAT